MDVAALCPFEVGIVRWRAPSPALTVIVKSTWTLAPGELVIAPAQEPLSGDRFDANQELVWASDFVPYKPRVDVVLLGRAHAAEPAPAIAVRLRVDDLDRVVYALSSEPAADIPLTEAYLRVEASSDAAETAVGPAPAWAGRSRGEGGDDLDLLGPSGRVRGSLRADFDFGLFNVAPPDQQVVPALREDARVVLEGVLPAGARLDARLPGVRPRVYLVDDAGGPTQELAVTFDTLVLDAERSLCVLEWRGAVVLDEGRSEPSLVVVATESLTEPTEWAAVLGDIFAARRATAAELPPEDDKPKLPRLNEPEVKGRWSDETTTKVRHAYGSKAPPANPETGDTRLDVRLPPRPRIPDEPKR